MSEARLIISQTPHRRVTAEADEDGGFICETRLLGTRAPTETVLLTHQELEKIARLFRKARRPPATKRPRNGGQRSQAPQNTRPPRP